MQTSRFAAVAVPVGPRQDGGAGGGAMGPPGVGVPPGGTALQILRKLSATNYETEWAGPLGDVAYSNDYNDLDNLPALITTFLGLSDTPATYAGQALKTLRVNAGETAVEFGVVLGTLAVGSSATDVPFTPTGGIAATNAATALAELDTEKVSKAGDTMTGMLSISLAAGNGLEVTDTVSGSGSEFVFNGNILSTFYSSIASSSTLIMRKARGTAAVPVDVLTNDDAGLHRYQGYFGAFRNIALIRVTVIETTPSATALAGRLSYSVNAVGSVVPSEILRLEHAVGLSLFGANPVIDSRRHYRDRIYTIATLPTPAVAGENIFCSDLGGGAGKLVSTAASSVWRRHDEGNQANATNADFTLTTLTDAQQVRHTGTLTADRAVTLSTTRAYAGAKFRITRTGTGAFNLNVGTGPLKALITNTWGEFVYDGAAWYLAAYGAL